MVEWPLGASPGIRMGSRERQGSRTKQGENLLSQLHGSSFLKSKTPVSKKIVDGFQRSPLTM